MPVTIGGIATYFGILISSAMSRFPCSGVGCAALSTQARQRRAAGRLFIETGPDFPGPDGDNSLPPSGVIHAASESY